MKVEINKNIDSIYTRPKVNQMISSIGFGRGSLDDIYIVLDYIYTDEELCNRFGNNFEISPNDISGGSDMSTMFPMTMKGSGQYEIIIQDSSFLVKVEKSYMGKWKVTDVTEVTESVGEG